MELGRVLQELDYLDDFLFGLLDTGDVGERDAHLVLAQQTGPALAERHGTASTTGTLHLPHEVDPHGDEQEDREGRDE